MDIPTASRTTPEPLAPGDRVRDTETGITGMVVRCSPRNSWIHVNWNTHPKGHVYPVGRDTLVKITDTQ